MSYFRRINSSSKLSSETTPGKPAKPGSPTKPAKPGSPTKPAKLVYLNGKQIEAVTSRYPCFYGPQSFNNMTSEINSILHEKAKNELANRLRMHPLPEDKLETFADDFLETLEAKHYKAIPSAGHPIGINLPGTIIGQLSQTTLNSGKKSGQSSGDIPIIDMVKNILLARRAQKGANVIIGLNEPWDEKGKAEELTIYGHRNIRPISIKYLVKEFQYFTAKEFVGKNKLEWWHDKFFEQNSDNFQYVSVCRMIFDTQKLYGANIILGNLILSGVLQYKHCIMIPSPTHVGFIDVFLLKDYEKEIIKESMKIKKFLSSQKHKANKRVNKSITGKVVLNILIEETAKNIVVQGVRGIESYKFNKVSTDNLVERVDTRELYQSQPVSLRYMDISARDIRKYIPTFFSYSSWLRYRSNPNQSVNVNKYTEEATKGSTPIYLHRVYLNRNILQKIVVGETGLRNYVEKFINEKYLIAMNERKEYIKVPLIEQKEDGDYLDETTFDFRMRDKHIARYLVFEINLDSDARKVKEVEIVKHFSKNRSVGKLSLEEGSTKYLLRIHGQYLDEEKLSTKKIKEAILAITSGISFSSSSNNTGESNLVIEGPINNLKEYAEQNKYTLVSIGKHLHELRSEDAQTDKLVIREEIIQLINSVKFHGYKSKIHPFFIEFKSYVNFDKELSKKWPEAFHYQTAGGLYSDISSVVGVDPNVSYSSDTHDLSHILGINTCANICVKILHDIFASIGGVDIRHLRLIVSEISSSGYIRSLKNQRAGRGDFITLAGFQQIPIVLANASLFKNTEKLKGSVTVPVAIGSLPPLGTGYVHVEIREKPIEKFIESDGSWYNPPVEGGQLLTREQLARLKENNNRDLVLPPVIDQFDGVPSTLLEYLQIDLEVTYSLNTIDFDKVYLPPQIRYDDTYINIDVFMNEIMKVNFLYR